MWPTNRSFALTVKMKLNQEQWIRYFVVTAMIVYLFFRAAKGVGRIRENVTGYAI